MFKAPTAFNPLVFDVVPSYAHNTPAFTLADLESGSSSSFVYRHQECGSDGGKLTELFLNEKCCDTDTVRYNVLRHSGILLSSGVFRKA